MPYIFRFFLLCFLLFSATFAHAEIKAEKVWVVGEDSIPNYPTAEAACAARVQIQNDFFQGGMLFSLTGVDYEDNSYDATCLIHYHTKNHITMP